MTTLHYCYNHLYTDTLDNIVEQYISRCNTDTLPHIVKKVDTAKKIKTNKQTLPTEEISDHYVFNKQNINIGHYVHKFIHFYYRWLQNKKKILYYSFDDTFKDSFFTSVFTDKYITFQKPDTVYTLINCSEAYYTGRNLQSIPDYISIVKDIRDKCFSYYNIQPNRTLTVLYDRNDVQKKNIKNIDTTFLHTNNIVHISDLITGFTFKETLRLLSQTKKFIIPVGAGCFNYIFLDTTSQVFEINPHAPNSWARQFGLYKMVDRHIIYVSNNTEKCMTATQQYGGDDHIIFDKKLLKVLSKQFNLINT